MSEKKGLYLCTEILRKSELYQQYSIAYILRKTTNAGIQYIASIYDIQDRDDMSFLNFNSDDNFYFKGVADWIYNVDDYFLAELEKGYEIEYMPLEEHYNIWWQIEDMRDEIDHNTGLQAYLSYCHKNSISKHEIEMLNLEKVDIMDMYIEKNAGYTIIAEMKCGEKAVVLAERKNNPDRFVTWRTTVNRSGGFDLGYYYSDFTSAYHNFEKRCHDMMNNELSIIKSRCKPKKLEHER